MGGKKGKGIGGSGSRLNGNVGGEKKGSVVESRVGQSIAVQGRNDSGWGDNNDGNLKQPAKSNNESSESKDLEQREADHAEGEKLPFWTRPLHMARMEKNDDCDGNTSKDE